ncbi:hypothetical protein T484DRAFT_1755551 [Baffinella frigidus]|nr:hypothetical protein T484DRAFT_1755551 [Cryptophyta sp. CCMP2293]
MRKTAELSTTDQPVPNASVPPVKKTATTKKPRAQPSKKHAPRPPRKNARRIPIITKQIPVDADIDSNPASSSERSPTPTEPDLLQYITVNVTPPTSIIDNHTVFSIDMAEYLRGVVRLIHSDCPEIGAGVGNFLNSMARAFIEVTRPEGSIGEVSYAVSYMTTSTALEESPPTEAPLTDVLPAEEETNPLLDTCSVP